jgi:hypothetical protein
MRTALIKQVRDVVRTLPASSRALRVHPEADQNRLIILKRDNTKI